ncbi:MAG: leucine-rich repeat domain-containing protein [Ruminococcaceae bacterium]|nr:leucine-rich repeat domain-containing protein [Oscillospiraceae bacterium]
MSNQKAQEDYLRETKALMKEKLISHGVAVTDSTPFRAYVNSIDLAVANATASMEPDEEVEALREKIRLILSSETPDTLELTAEDFAGVDIVRRYAMYSHPSLTSVEIHSNVLSIDPNAFYGCKKLETVILPRKVKLQANCFGNCTGLKRVYLPSAPTVHDAPNLINNNAFPDATTCPDLRFILPSQESQAVYLNLMSSTWGNLIEGRYQILDEVTET